MMLRAAINDSMDRHPSYLYESDSDCYDNCCECERCAVAPFMVSFFDHNHNHLVSNWLSGSFNCAGGCNQSSLIDELSAYFNIDIAHLMWNYADEYLHKVRYIRIGDRKSIKDEDGYSVNVETGIEYDIYRKTMERYRSKWSNAGVRRERTA